MFIFPFNYFREQHKKAGYKTSFGVAIDIKTHWLKVIVVFNSGANIFERQGA